MSDALTLPVVIGLVALSTLHAGVAAFVTAFLAVVVLASD